MNPGQPENTPSAAKGFWPACRTAFRRLRLALWLMVALLMVVLLYLNQAGLPGFLKRPLLDRLRARGIAVGFEDLRLSWHRGLVAYHVRFGPAGEQPSSPRLEAECVQLGLDVTRLTRLDFQVSGLTLRNARLTWPLDGTNRFALENINADLHFLPDDCWQLDALEAQLAGGRLLVTATLSNASALRHWRLFPRSPTNAPAASPPPMERLRRAAEALVGLRFLKPPGLRLDVTGDARFPNQFSGTLQLILPGVATARSRVNGGGFFARFGPAARPLVPTNDLPPWLAALTPYECEWRCVVASAHTPRLDFSGLSAQGRWQAPDFKVTSFRAGLSGGNLQAQATLNTRTRELAFGGASDFDLQQIRPLLTKQAAQWIGRFAWEKPPALTVEGSARLPARADTWPDWHREVLPTLRLDGRLSVGRASFRGVPVLAARSRVVYSNQTWRLPDLRITWPEGELRAEHWTEERTRDYYWRLEGALHPAVVRPFLDPPEQRGFDYVHFNQPAQIDLQIWSRWYERERTAVSGRVTVSNFAIRGEPVSSLDTALTYTNLHLRLVEPRITRGTEHAVLSSVDLDFTRRMAYLSNGVGIINPLAIARCIGPKTTRLLEPYQFLSPPDGRIEGSVSLDNSRISDLHVTLDGGPFHWWRFTVPRIRGDIAWVNSTVLLTNITADFYEGRLDGNMFFQILPPEVDDLYHFDFRAADCNLARLMSDLGSRSNQLTGRVSGRLTITNASTHDLRSWQGHGDAQLRHGQLWELPVFGFFAVVLDTFYPNLGSGRASDGTATFLITNGVVSTDNFQLRSPAFRMQYRGTVDFAGQLNARAEAEVLRNTVIIGPLVSTALWPVSKLFEYRISGNLSQPQTRPVYIPRLLLLPLHPLQTLKDIFSDRSSGTNTPARPAEPEKTGTPPGQAAGDSP